MPNFSEYGPLVQHRPMDTSGRGGGRGRGRGVGRGAGRGAGRGDRRGRQAHEVRRVTRRDGRWFSEDNDHIQSITRHDEGWFSQDGHQLDEAVVDQILREGGAVMTDQRRVV